MNSFGRLFRIQIYGESHTTQVGILIDGCPPGIPISVDDFLDDMLRRKPGKHGTTQRMEADVPVITSGVFRGFTTGAPIHIFVKNQDHHSDEYLSTENIPRPGHADYVAYIRYKGFNDLRGGGMFSGRLTAALVLAGVIAKKIIAPTKVEANVITIGGSDKEWEKIIEHAIQEGDSLGGLVECRVNQVPVGLGEPFFDSVESLIAHAIFSIPGIKGIEFGDGFRVTTMKGSEYNDIILPDGKFATNHAGGIHGGLTNGNDIIFRIAVRPPASIRKPQQTINLNTGKSVSISVGGRHDVCFALRIPPIVEALTACVIADLLLIAKSW
ncbi:MAG: chorismate synthase [Bacteroidales bacterium]|nr:chorismate synthase [Bacteroidales bacterium]